MEKEISNSENSEQKLNKNNNENINNSDENNINSNNEYNENYKENNNQYSTTFNISNENLQEKIRRTRSSKNVIEGRNFKCPECGKCYLSSPALTNHRKTKHNYGTEGEKKGRGRPRKEQISSSSLTQSILKFENFFLSDLRKIKNEEKINLSLIKNDLNEIFKQYKNEIFIDIDSFNKYQFGNFIIENWEKENPELEKNSRTAILGNEGNEEQEIINKPNIDSIFFLYLKELSNLTNKDYFWFILKFIILFRECINQFRDNLINKNHISEKKNKYTQIYCAETIPDICNDFCVDFMEQHKNFGIDILELVEIVQHFCYWLYVNKYTLSQLTLLN